MFRFCADIEESELILNRETKKMNLQNLDEFFKHISFYVFCDFPEL
jgi:hypothetical protein